MLGRYSKTGVRRTHKEHPHISEGQIPKIRYKLSNYINVKGFAVLKTPFRDYVWKAVCQELLQHI